jgi:hypothetical protein
MEKRAKRAKRVKREKRKRANEGRKRRYRMGLERGHLIAALPQSSAVGTQVKSLQLNILSGQAK